MNELETNRQRANLLAQARILLNDEYQRQRAEQYSKWQVESNHLWVTKGILLPYPSSFGYPTEEEVVKKALELYNKQNGIQTDSTTPLPETDDSMTVSVTAKLNQISQNVKPVELPQVPQTTPWEQYAPPLPEITEEPETVSETAVEEVPEEISTAEELEQAIEEVLEKEEPGDKKETSTLRTLLAQFVTIAKKLDSDKNKEETK
jgi:hypothetical protein